MAGESCDGDENCDGRKRSGVSGQRFDSLSHWRFAHLIYTRRHHHHHHHHRCHHNHRHCHCHRHHKCRNSPQDINMTFPITHLSTASPACAVPHRCKGWAYPYHRVWLVVCENIGYQFKYDCHRHDKSAICKRVNKSPATDLQRGKPFPNGSGDGSGCSRCGGGSHDCAGG